MSRYEIPPLFNGKNIKSQKGEPKFSEEEKEKRRERLMKNRFVSKAEAEANPELMPLYLRTIEIQKKGASAGGKARAKQLKERKMMRERLNELLSADYENLEDFLKWQPNNSKKNAIPDTVKKWFNDRGEDISVQDCVLLAVVKNAAFRGDIRSIEFLRDTLGEKPKVEVEQNTNIKNVEGFSNLANALYGSKSKDADDDKKGE